MSYSQLTMSFQDFVNNVMVSKYGGGGINVFSGGRTSVTATALTPDEVNTITNVVNKYARLLAKVSPSLAETVTRQLPAVLSFAEVAKAEMGDKPITFPATSGSIGITPLIPQFINYGTIGTYVAQTGYPLNTWEVTLTAGSAFYLLGSSTAFYVTSGQPNQRFAILILEDGLIEVGTTPKTDQFLVQTSVESKYDPYTTMPLFDEPIEVGKAIYQYPTLGAMFIDWNIGYKWSLMPRTSGTSSLRLLGFAFYEYGVFNGSLWYP